MEEEPREASVESSSEDENGELVNDHLEGKFLNVLAKLRAKDPSMYTVEKPLFEEQDFQDGDHGRSKSDKQKFTYKDMERERILKKTNEDLKDEEQDQMDEQAEPTPYELQKKLKKEFQKSAFAVDPNEDDLLIKVKKSSSKAAPVESEGTKLRKLAKDKNEEEVLQRFWGDDSKLNETDLFLKRYILNKEWIDTEGNLKKKINPKIEKEDEQRSEEIDEYQEKFNHRFEQPSGAHLQTFPRRIDESLRLKKQSRKDKRTKREQLKKQKLMEELKQAEKLKAKKKQQISDRIAEIQEENGVQNVQIQQEQVNYDEDEDENKVWFYCDDCERGLQQSQTYYTCADATCEGYSLCKPCYDLIIHKHPLNESTVPEGCGAPDEQQVRLTLNNLLKCRKCKHSINEYEKRYELIDPDSNFKYNYCVECQDLLPLSLRKKCKEIKEKKVKLDQVLEKDPKKLNEFVDDDEVSRLLREYQGLDFNQITSEGMKTKFKYIDVKPESYGLSDEQILYSDDRQLNKYVSIRKLAPYLEENLRLRNNIYNTKIKSISRSAKLNRKRVETEKDPEYGVNRIKLLKKRADRRKKNAERTSKQMTRIRLTDLSTKEAQLRHFVPKSRLESYGIMEQ